MKFKHLQATAKDNLVKYICIYPRDSCDSVFSNIVVVIKSKIPSGEKQWENLKISN